LNVIWPVKKFELETHELLGTVPACVAVRLRMDRPTPLTVFCTLVPKPDPMFVVAVTVVILSAKTVGVKVSKNKTTNTKTPGRVRIFLALGVAG